MRMIRDIRLPLISRRMPTSLTFTILALMLLSSSILQIQSILASTNDNGDPSIQASEDEATLTVKSADFKTKREFSGMNIAILSGEQVIGSDLTPATFTLTAGKYVVLASNENSTFFSRWSDTIVEGIAREVTVGSSGLNLTALYRVIPDAREVSVTVNAYVLDEDDTTYPLTVVESTVQYVKSNRHSTLDSGRPPKVYNLAEGIAYRVIATNSEDTASGNFKFDHWVDPVNNEMVRARSLEFIATDDLVLDAIYREDSSTTVVIPIESRLENGTVIEGVYNKAVDLSEPQSAPADEGFTPVNYILERDRDFAAVASEVCGFCLSKSIVFDHWEATGGPFISRTVYSDEYEFSTRDVASRVDSLTAIYRIVPDDDFSLIPVNTTGTDVRVEIPPKINDGITLEFGEVVDNGNITAAENGVASDVNIFDDVDLTRGNASMKIAVTSGANLTITTFETYGPVLRINDGNLTLAGTTNITIHYDLSKLPVGLEPSMLHMLHFDGIEWKNVTLSRNEANKTVTGAVTSLSPFVIAWDSKFGIGGVKGPDPVVESKRGGGGGAPRPLENVSTLQLEPGVDVSTSLAIGPSKNDTAEFALEEVTSAGKITLATATSPELKSLFAGGTTNRTLILGSNFTALGLVYKVTADNRLAFSGKIEISIPYNETSIGASGSNVTEEDVRLLYHNGSVWEDSTILGNASANTVTGRMSSLASPAFVAVAVVHDKTYGHAYIEMNPQKKVSMDDIDLAADLGIGAIGPVADGRCLEDESGMQQCLITLTGSIRNAQRTSQSYAIVIQTTDEKGVAQSIESVTGLLEKAQTAEFDLAWKVEYSDTPSHHRVQLLVLDGLLEETNMIAEAIELDLDLA